MINIKQYIEILIEKLQSVFGSRLIYVGLQGSYNRGEATENSDIDIMVIINELSLEDLKKYKEIILDIGNYEKSCGFICGKKELANWNPLEICHLLNSTSDYYGKLKDFVPEYSKKDIADYIKISVGNLYHLLCHRYTHSALENSFKGLPEIIKEVFFILQNVYYLETGHFIQRKQDASSVLKEKDLKVWNKLIEIQHKNDYNFDEAFSIILNWCTDIFERTSFLKNKS